MDEPLLPAMQELYDSAPCGLLVTDAQGRILDVNTTFCRWLKHPRSELLAGRRLQDLLTMGGRIFHQTHVAPLLRIQGSVGEVKLELRAADGRTLPMMLNLAERAWRGRVLVQVAAFLAEDRHKYERELLLQRQRAEQLADQHAQDQRDLASARAQAEDRAQLAELMMGVVSHDLRNPVSVIQMSALLLEKGGGLDERQKTAVARMLRSAQRAERLISDLLDFTQTRLGSGLHVQPASVNLHEAVAEGLAELRMAFPGRLLGHEARGDGRAQVDADRINQAVGNLVANAMRHGDPTRPVTVTTEGLGHELAVRVHNHGAPIAADQQARLFEPMVRGDAASGIRGVGLGLYIVREIARAHGGRVEVQSDANTGTTFSLLLPRAAL